MSGLEQTFYIMGIVFMSLIFLMMIALLAAVLVIRQKISRIHDSIEDKIDLLTSLVPGKAAFSTAKKVLKKATK